MEDRRLPWGVALGLWPRMRLVTVVAALVCDVGVGE